MHLVELETLVGKELGQLSLPRAPHTLVPRVLAAVQEWAGRPWYAREWFTWPLAWQVLSFGALILLVGGSATLLSSAVAVTTGAGSTFAPDLVRDVAGIAGRVGATTNAARIFWRTLLEPFAAYMSGLVALMCLACAAFGAALTYVIPGRALQP